MPDTSAVDISVVKQLVIEAGREELLPRFQQTSFFYKQDGSIVTEADISVQNRLQQALNDHFPDIPLLGEEMTEHEQTAIIAHDLEFWRKLPFLFPHEDRRPHFEGKEKHAAETAFRNGTLQGAYFMIAARAVGLDVGPMSGFSNSVVDEEFFQGTTLRSNFLCNLGYADESALFHKLPRFAFDEVCSFA